MIPSGIQTSLFDLFWYVLMMASENELGGALESVQIFSLVKPSKLTFLVFSNSGRCFVQNFGEKCANSWCPCSCQPDLEI